MSATTFSVSVAKAIVFNESAVFESVPVTGRVRGGFVGTLFVAALPKIVLNSLFPVG